MAGSAAFSDALESFGLAGKGPGGLFRLWGSAAVKTALGE